MLMIFRRLAAVVIVAIAATLTAQGSYSDILKIRRANRGISALRSMKDGEHYTVLSKNAIIRTAYADKSKSDTLFTAPCAVAGYTLSADEHMVLLPKAASVKPIYRHSYTADYMLMSGQQQLANFEAVRDMTFSPDGNNIAYSKGNNLYLYNIINKSTTAITTDGCWNKIINGTSDWVYEEEYGFTRAYAFSNDGKKIAYLRFDESQVPTFEMMRFDNTL